MGTGKMHEDRETAVEAFFTAARQVPPAPEPAFLARLVVQAEAVQAEAVQAKVVQAKAVRVGPGFGEGGAGGGRGIFAALASALGGWGSLGGMAGGMATATVAGLWIGLAGAPGLVQAVGLGAAVAPSATEEALYLDGADILALAITE